VSPRRSPPTLEAFLARLYADRDFALRARSDPRAAAAAFGLDEASCALVARIDWAALDLASASFAAKREAKRAAR
jgi:hypothetical protein